MKKIRKALSVCLVLLLMMTSFPMAGIADFDIGITASALDAAGNCGENATYTFDSETGELVISGTGAIEEEAFHSNKEILKATIESGITEISDRAFCECDELATLVVGSDVTIIGDNAFADCGSLTDIYYDGIEEEWNAISIGENNDELKNATIYFAEVPECGHANVTLVPQVDATCTESGVIEYYYCADCDGKLVLNEGFYEYLDGSEEIPSLGHGHTLGFDEISAVPAT